MRKHENLMEKKVILLSCKQYHNPNAFTTPFKVINDVHLDSKNSVLSVQFNCKALLLIPEVILELFCG